MYGTEAVVRTCKRTPDGENRLREPGHSWIPLHFHTDTPIIFPAHYRFEQDLKERTEGVCSTLHGGAQNGGRVATFLTSNRAKYKEA